MLVWQWSRVPMSPLTMAIPQSIRLHAILEVIVRLGIIVLVVATMVSIHHGDHGHHHDQGQGGGGGDHVRLTVSFV